MKNTLLYLMMWVSFGVLHAMEDPRKDQEVDPLDQKECDLALYHAIQVKNFEGNFEDTVNCCDKLNHNEAQEKAVKKGYCLYSSYLTHLAIKLIGKPHMVKEHSGAVEGIDYAPDGKQFLTWSEDTVYIWGNNDSKGIKDILYIRDAYYLPNSEQIVVQNLSPTLYIVNTKFRNHRKSQGPSDRISKSICFYKDEEMLIATGADDGTVRILNAETGRCLKQLSGHKHCVKDIIYLADAQKIVTCSFVDATVRQWNIETGKGAIVNAFNDKKVYHMASTQDGKKIAASFIHEEYETKEGGFLLGGKRISTVISKEVKTRILDVASGEYIDLMHMPETYVKGMDYHSNGKALALCFHDDTKDSRKVGIWNTENGECITLFDDHKKSVNRVKFSPDGKTLATCSDDKTICFYKIFDKNFIKNIDFKAMLLLEYLLQKKEKKESVELTQAMLECYETLPENIKKAVPFE
jgi:WD40 repeat protein